MEIKIVFYINRKVETIDNLIIRQITHHHIFSQILYPQYYLEYLMPNVVLF